MTDAPASAPRSATSERVDLRTMHERRRRVWRAVIMFMLVTAAMVVLSIMNRDEAGIRACRERMEDARRAFQEVYERGAPMPPMLPLPTDAGRDGESQQRVLSLRGHVYYDVLHDRRRGDAREVGVCCCRWPHTRLIGPSGRHVIIFNAERNQYEVRWMGQEEFKRRADELGLADPAER